MDIEITVAVISGAFGLLASLIAVREARDARLEKARAAQIQARAQETVAQIQAASLKATETAVKRVPYAVDQIRTTVVIEDEAGNGSMKRELIGIKARVGERLARFKTRLWTSGAFERGVVEVTHSEIRKGISVSKTFPNPRTCEIELTFIGGLLDTDPLLDVSVSARTTKAHLLRESDITAAYVRDRFKYEYLTEQIDAEVHNLQIDVTFPEGLKPVTYPIAFLFGGEDEATDQMSTLPSLDESAPNHARLAVQRPSPSFAYGIYWMGLK